MRKLAVVMVVVLAVTPVAQAGIFGEIDKFFHSITEGVTEKDKITGLRSLSFYDRKAQIKEADAHAASILKQYGGNINERVSRSQYSRLKKIFERVHKVSHFRNEKWKVVLLPKEDFNAFVTGGTYVFANLGFMKFCNDDEVAAVIGHEIGHVVANHQFESRSYMIAAVLADAKNLKKTGYAEGFNRNQEAEADKIGVMYSALAGYDPEAGSTVWIKMMKKGIDHASMTRTHPMNEDRARNNAKYAKQVKQYYTSGKINPDFEKLLVKNVLWNASGSELEAGEGGGLAAVLSAAADTAVKHYGAKAERESMRQRTEFVKSVEKVVRMVQNPQISQDGKTMRVGFQYVGNIQLNNISFVSMVTVGEHSLELSGNSGGPITPGLSFYVDFSNPNLAGYAPYIYRGQAGISYEVTAAVR
ncbi:MAG: M48 family metallopeptidase [Thermodesulfobacteriota bacterium]